MNKFRKSLLVTALMVAGVTSAHAVNTSNNNFTMYDGTGSLVGSVGDVGFVWDGTYNTAAAGALDNATISNANTFYGEVWTAKNVKVFAPGTYAIPPSSQGGPGYTLNVGAGQVGMHMLFDWNGNVNISVIEVCESGNFVFSDGAASACVSLDTVADDYTGSPGCLDVDVDLGIAMNNGPFVCFNPNFNLRGLTVPTVPIKSSNIPAVGAAGQSTTTAISATFSEAMDPASVTTATFTVKIGGGATACDSISASNLVAAGAAGNKTNTDGYLTFTCVHAAALTINSAYTAALSTAVKSVTGIPLAAAVSWNFGTGAGADVTAPLVSGALTPVNGAGPVVNTQPIAITFNEPMAGTTAGAMTVTSNGGMAVAGGFTTSDNLTFTFVPTAGVLPSSSTIVVTVPANGAVKDGSNNALAVSPPWSFTTNPLVTLPVGGGSVAIQGGAAKMVSVSTLSGVDAGSLAASLGQTPPAGVFASGFLRFAVNNAGAAGAITTVRLDFNTDISNKAIYKFKASTGQYIPITQGAGADQYEPVSGNLNAIDLHIANDGSLDDVLEAQHPGVIDPDIGPLTPPAAAGVSQIGAAAGGGGCTVNPNGGTDASLLAALLASLGYLGLRRRRS